VPKSRPTSLDAMIANRYLQTDKSLLRCDKPQALAEAGFSGSALNWLVATDGTAACSLLRTLL